MQIVIGVWQLVHALSVPPCAAAKWQGIPRAQQPLVLSGQGHGRVVHGELAGRRPRRSGPAIDSSGAFQRRSGRAGDGTGDGTGAGVGINGGRDVGCVPGHDQHHLFILVQHVQVAAVQPQVEELFGAQV